MSRFEVAVLAVSVIVVVYVGIFGVGGIMFGYISHLMSQPGEASPSPRVPTPGLTNTPPALRCTNGPTPRVWTRTEAEASLHAAQMSLRSAEQHGVWTALGQRWAQMAEAQFAEVALCWRAP